MARNAISNVRIAAIPKTILLNFLTTPYSPPPYTFLVLQLTNDAYDDEHHDAYDGGYVCVVRPRSLSDGCHGASNDDE